ncbi:MAG: FAD-dependent oxidoreductase, partial [Planctomycetota bacterium]
MLHPTHAGADVQRELLSIALGLFDYVKNSGEYPEAENLALAWIGQLPARRSGLRFLGDHILRQQDLEEPPGFPDGVAYGGWPMDRHPPEGFFSPEPPADFLNVPDLYSIPLGSLYSRNVENLYLAGRCHSATYTAHGSTRVMGTCVSMGQAAGMAAAVGIEKDASPRTVRESFAGEVQQRLLKEDAFLVGISNTDPADLARSAQVAASSQESPELGPERATNGVSRPRDGAMNLWASAPGRVAGEWVELSWDSVQTVNEVR